MEQRIYLFHSGYSIIDVPDVRHGRKNADLGQGFYTAAEREFALRWEGVRRGETTYINHYELDLWGLNVLRFERDPSWFDYIYSNRNNLPDLYPDADVIIGPIANDTIYDTFGIITSGLLEREEAMNLLMIGPVYTQIVIRSEKAVRQLKFLRAEILEKEQIEQYREAAAQEEKEYQKLFAAEFEKMQ